MHYRITDRDTLYQGFFKLELCRVACDRHSGGSAQLVLENFERGDAVAVVLYDPCKDEVLLIEQFRIGPAIRQDRAWLIEIVAGMIEGDEPPDVCARRECIEEAGYEPSTLKPLGCYYVSPGGTSERIFLYLGEVDAEKPVADGGGLSYEHEDIRHFWVGRAEALNMVKDGRINSSAPMLALLKAFEESGMSSPG